MQSRWRVWILSPLLLWSATSLAIQGCDEGGVGANLNPLDDPEEVRQCRIMGRAFCKLTVMRAAGVAADPAIHRSAEWFGELDQKGTHLKANYTPLVSLVSQYVYSHPPMPPWTSYYYGVYTCGLGSRLSGDDARRRAALVQWEKSATACEVQFPSKGEGYGNDGLKVCLAGAMKTISGGSGKQHAGR